MYYNENWIWGNIRQTRETFVWNYCKTVLCCCSTKRKKIIEREKCKQNWCPERKKNTSRLFLMNVQMKNWNKTSDLGLCYAVPVREYGINSCTSLDVIPALIKPLVFLALNLIQHLLLVFWFSMMCSAKHHLNVMRFAANLHYRMWGVCFGAKPPLLAHKLL